ncbi:MAG: sulfur oxidation c-type cytochrome SoxA [Pseudomonadota bacterium]
MRFSTCCWLGLVFVIVGFPDISIAADVNADRDSFRQIYHDKFPTVALSDFVYGVYAIDPALKQQWEEVNEFPPYEFALDDGKSLVEQTLADGTDLLDCLGTNPVTQHPYFDEEQQEIVTLDGAVNRCRVEHGESKLSYQTQELQNLVAYLTFLERRQLRKTPAPESMAAKNAYERGRAFFYTKRGQLNLSCADCHIKAAGLHLREQTLTPLLGVINHFPIYSLRAGALGSLHQRFVGCIEQVRGESNYLQSSTFRELEYFLALMSDGLPIVGPMTQR